MAELILSVGIVAFNEEACLPELLSDLSAQDYPKKSTEILLIDSLSSDQTPQIFQKFQAEYGALYHDVKVLDNPGKIQAAGWNVAIKNFTGDALIRVDAHAKLTKDFIFQNARCLLSGEMMCGGKRPNIIKNPTAPKRLVLMADNSMFGGSFMSYHSSDTKHYTDSVFHGCYRREVIERVGLFNEKLGRTEDNDYNYRVRAAGYKIAYDPNIVSYQYSRGSLSASLRQKFGNGYWIGRTTAISPKCISLFHYVPFLFLLALIFTVFLGLFGIWWPFLLLAVAYGAADFLLSVLSVLSEKPFSPLFVALPVLFLLLHVSYGVGTLCGFFSLLKRQKW